MQLLLVVALLVLCLGFRRVLAVILTVLLLALALSCSESSSPTTPTPTVSPTSTPTWNLSGTVTESGPASTPIAGAAVTGMDGPNEGTAATSDSQGAYQFTGLEAGQLSINASAEGYESSTANISLTSDTTLDFLLESTVATGVLTGRIREYASSSGDLDPVAGVRIRVTSGSAQGRSDTSDDRGRYRLEELPEGMLTLSLSKNGFQDLETTAQVSSRPRTLNILIRRECSPWPPEVQRMRNTLSLPRGLCLIRQPNGRTSNYQTQTRTIFLRRGAPATGELGSLAHELGHAHQHQAVLAAGLGEPGFDDDFIPKWVRTREGRRFIEVTGWRHNPSADQNRPPFGWTEGQCEPWSCGIPNPLEDSAEFIAAYFDVTNSWSPGDLRRQAPNRYKWAEEFFGR